MHTERHILGDIELSARPRTRIEEQRRTARKALSLTAEIRLPNGKILDGRTADISREGIGFFSPVRIDSGGDCTLMIRIDACGTAAELKLIGRVAHCTKQSEDYFRIGMKFIRMDEATAAIICTALR